MRLDTGERMLLGDDEAYAAQYVSTGHLVYGREGIVMAVPFDLDENAMSGAAIQMLSNVFTKQAGAQSITISDDGSLAFIPVDATEERRLFWVDRTGETTPVEGAPIRNYGVPRLSPNGNRIAVQVVGGPSETILQYDFGRSTMSTVSVGAPSMTPPVWTVDGERITFVAPDGNVQSILADGSGSVETLLVRQDQGRQSPWHGFPTARHWDFSDEVGLLSSVKEWRSYCSRRPESTLPSHSLPMAGSSLTSRRSPAERKSTSARYRTRNEDGGRFR